MTECPIATPCPLSVDPWATEMIDGKCPKCGKDFYQMPDKFVSPGTPCTPHQHELLTILIEECGEVITRATKAKRFGLDEKQPGQEHTNAERLAHEIGDVLVMIELCEERCGVSRDEIVRGMEHKNEQLLKYMQTSPDDYAKEAVNG
jgi:NTP pyrophosphatase (non-canonical NTP hydrolase)